MTQPVELLQAIKPEAEAADKDIYIIDDDNVFSYMLQDYLISAGSWKSGLFSNSDEFFKIYKADSNCKIILDYEFDKGLNGLQMLRKIKSINPRASVIMVSGLDDLEKALETLRSGATDYFLKTNATVFANIHCALIKLLEIEKLGLN